MHALTLVVIALCVMAVAYRYYSAFIAAKVIALDDNRVTPAHRFNDGQNYQPTNRYVLFGHHFAAIAGAGPLIGPVLAAQFGYMPGFLWLVVGVVIGGAVHDFVALAASARRNGKSIAEIARIEISPLAGIVGTIAILIIVVVALAGLGAAVVNAVAESPWGAFTILLTIPIAMFVGIYMTKLRPGKVAEATVIGVVAVLIALALGHEVQESAYASWFRLSREGIIIALAVYGFIASVLPVWLLLAPRDYLSSYMKIGTVFLLIAGVIYVNPELKIPAFTEYISGGGPILQGKLFPFLFITIACGAISGFHSLVASGTTPKMLNRESDARFIGYGAMLMESVVGVIALIAAASMHPGDYYAINLSAEKFALLGIAPVELSTFSRLIGENLSGRTGGAVSLAIGFAQIFSGLPGMNRLVAYWYHFAIMFEALFILTTIDSGTRVARFLLQEFVGKVWKPFGRENWMPGAYLSTGLIVVAWGYLLWTGDITTIWPMFGTANQLLAVVALAVGTSAIINSGKFRYAWVTFIPMAFVATTTLTAGVLNITDTFWPMTRHAATSATGWVNIGLSVIIMACAVVVIIEAFRKWGKVLIQGRPAYEAAALAHVSEDSPAETRIFRCC